MSQAIPGMLINVSRLRQVLGRRLFSRTIERHEIKATVPGERAPGVEATAWLLIRLDSELRLAAVAPVVASVSSVVSSVPARVSAPVDAQQLDLAA